MYFFRCQLLLLEEYLNFSNNFLFEQSKGKIISQLTLKKTSNSSKNLGSNLIRHEKPFGMKRIVDFLPQLIEYVF